MFMLSLLQFGTQQTYSNLITTFSVLGPLHFTETEGVYISSLFWTFLCFGRLAGRSLERNMVLEIDLDFKNKIYLWHFGLVILEHLMSTNFTIIAFNSILQMSTQSM